LAQILANCSRRREVDQLIHVHFMSERSQKRRLRELSARDDLSMATFVREAIDHYLRVSAGPTARQVRHEMLDAVGSLPVAGLEPDDGGGNDQDADESLGFR
jgi:hypothetical protein